MKIGDDMNKKGFTMIELLGVITILGILMVVAIPAVYQYVKKSKDLMKQLKVKQLILWQILLQNQMVNLYTLLQI